MAISIRSIGTASPARVMTQREAEAVGAAVFASQPSRFERLRPVYANAGIEQRHICQPLSWYHEPKSWGERNRLYLEHAEDLIAEAGQRALDQAGLTGGEIDTVVCVSTTGIATPSLEARVAPRLGLRSTVERLPIFGLGCAGGAMGLARAAALAAPGRRVLLLVVELCALTFRERDRRKANVIATALFGDGAAAVVLENHRDEDPTHSPRILSWGEELWANSLDIMGWSVEPDGLGVIFSQQIPSFIEREFAPAVDRFLADRKLSRRDLAGYVCHPGGAKVLSALDHALTLPPASLSAAQRVLRDHGNMSAATVLYVLKQMMEQGMRGRYLLCALGPGFSAAFVLLEVS